MAISKIVLNNTTQIDLTDTTAVASDVATGKYFYGADGVKITGTASGSGYVEPEPLDVDFIDYDGTLLHTYTVDDFLALSELPNNPTHDGLVSQGWNWSLADAKEYVAEYGSLVVGQNYITDDGKTRVYISLGANDTRLSKSVTVSIYAIDTAVITIDWGDETSTNKSSVGQQYITHNYAEYGDYIISIDIQCEGTLLLGYWGSNTSFVTGNIVRKIEIGANVTGTMSKCFRDMYDLESVSIPTTCVEYASRSEGNAPVFVNNYKMRGIVIPNGCAELGMGSISFITSAANMPLKYLSFPKSLTSIGIRNSFSNMVRLRKLTLPELVTDTSSSNFFDSLYHASHLVMPKSSKIVAGGAFTYIYNVRKLIIPETVTEIKGNYGLAFPYSMQELRCLPITPPTLGHNRFINYLPSDCIIYVPYSEDHSILEAYKTATNWSVGASKMQEEEP